MKVTVTRGFRYTHHHGDVGQESRPHEHTGAVSASVDRIGFAKPVDPLALQAALDRVSTPFYGVDLHEQPGLEPHLLSLAFRLRELLLPAFSDVMVKMTEAGLEVEVP